MAISNTKDKTLSIAEQHAEKGRAQPFTPIRAAGSHKAGEATLTFDLPKWKLIKLNLITFKSFDGKKKIARGQALDEFLAKYDADGDFIIDEEDKK